MGGMGSKEVTLFIVEWKWVFAKRSLQGPAEKWWRSKHRPCREERKEGLGETEEVSVYMWSWRKREELRWALEWMEALTYVEWSHRESRCQWVVMDRKGQWVIHPGRIHKDLNSKEVILRCWWLIEEVKVEDYSCPAESKDHQMGAGVSGSH